MENKKAWQAKVKFWTEEACIVITGDTVACVLHMIARLPDQQVKDLNDEMKKLGVHYS